MRKTYYVNGNTVRDLEDIQREEQERRKREAERRKKNRRMAVRRNREKAMGMSRSYVIFLTGCVILSAYAAFSLIQMQSQLTTRMKKVAALESQVENLRADNDTRYNEITTSIDLNQIKETAMNKLGMSYATEDQVIYYQVDKNNFMDQYSDIPKQ